jgi:hypothetical protein
MELTIATVGRSRELGLVAERLHTEFDRTAGTASVDAILAGETRRFAGARIDTFVPVLVERAARRRLRAGR